ncbi:MAG TPA: hypothetical protein VLA05_10065 [Coriobacteriia bacterium]|nr:hypothetical protein [Coriobacteriia bacterium]
MIQAITRFVFVAAGLVGGYVITKVVDWQAQLGLAPSYVIFLFVILGAAIGFVLGGIVGRELTGAWRRTEVRLSELAGVDLVLGTVGLVVGLLVAFLASQPLRLLEPTSLAAIVTVVMYIVAGYIGTTIALTRRREFVAAFPRFAPTEHVAMEDRLVALDTSAVIDGRFVELRRLGFLPGVPRVPRFVLAELQTLSDSADDTRRARGRRGLDLLATLPDDESVGVVEVDYPELAGVDEKLMRLAVDAHATIVTVDYNLTKVANVRGIDVLNLNEAAAALRPTFLPGDSLPLRVLKAGKEAGQGVGYLEDGTMVVVADGRALVGTEAEVEVTSVLQTSAGRMIFARPSSSAAPMFDGPVEASA